MDPKKPGLFFSLDGIDGCGKSTQCRLLIDWLRELDHTVVFARDPGGTVVGDQLRELVLHNRTQLALPAEALLFMASRAQLVAEILRPALLQRNTIVTDRFTLANVVYQGHAGGLNIEELWNVGRTATGGIEPDLTLVLDLPVEQARQRRSGPTDKIESRGVAFQEKVRQGFLTEANRLPKRIRVIDATGTVGDVHRLIRKEVEGVLATHQRT